MNNRISEPQPKRCEMCAADTPILFERYCKRCKKVKLAEMQESGYLTPVPQQHAGEHRTADMKELTYETKFGTSHG